MKNKRQQQGNVLFLILIAVALFAALSYAVTQSTRGGGNADDETTEIKVVEFLQQATLITSTIKRKYVLGYNGQIQLTQNAEDPAGTIYLPDRTTTTGTTVGFFTQEISGLNNLTLPIEIRTTTSSGWGIVYNAQLVHDGADVGTSLGDEYLRMRNLTEEACIAINEGLHGESRIGTLGTPAGTSSAVIDLIYGNTFLPTTTNFADTANVEFLPGCNASSTFNRTYFELIKEN